MVASDLLAEDYAVVYDNGDRCIPKKMYSDEDGEVKFRVQLSGSNKANNAKPFDTMREAAAYMRQHRVGVRMFNLTTRQTNVRSPWSPRVRSLGPGWKE